jgi:hypothetical protein
MLRVPRVETLLKPWAESCSPFGQASSPFFVQTVKRRFPGYRLWSRAKLHEIKLVRK